MDIKKIMSISIKTPEKPGEDTVVSVNGMEFRAQRLTGAISLALDLLGEASTNENIAQFIELSTKGVSPALTNAQTGENLVIPPQPEGITPPEEYRSDSPPAKPPKKSKGKVEKKAKPENELIGKVFLGKKGELFRLVAVTPPGDWQFEFECLDTDNRGGTKRLGLKEFKELTELIPKPSKKKETK